MICLAASMGYVGLVHAPVAALIIGKDVLMGLASSRLPGSMVTDVSNNSRIDA